MKALIPVLVVSTTTMMVSIIMLVRNCTFSEFVFHCKNLFNRLLSNIRNILIRIKIHELINRLKIPEVIAFIKPKVSRILQSVQWTKISYKIRQFIRISKLKEIFNNLHYGDRIGRFSSRFLQKSEARESSEISVAKESDTLNSRILLKNKKTDSDIDILTVEIYGSIRLNEEDSENKTANLKISILDITDGIKKAEPVMARNKQCLADGKTQQSAFYHTTSLGRLIHQVTTISNWTAVAQIPLDKLYLARKGPRKLQFEISVFINGNSDELTNTKTIFEYDNPLTGYLDLKENIERTKTLTVALAFAIGAADGNLNDRELEQIKIWSLNNFIEQSEGNTEKEKRKIFKALDKTATFFHKGNRLNIQQICDEAARISPAGQRYDILKLCLKVAQVKDKVGTEELSLLKDIAGWLELDNDKFRLLIQKYLPIDMHEERDIETILGITSDMTKEIARKKLNREYSKWNARVTNSDPNIQTQADQMLKLIAEVRNQYITK